MIKEISQNFIKKNLPLLTKKGRSESNMFIIEGEKYVSEIPIGWTVECYIISESFAHNDISAYEKRACVYIAKDHQYKKLSDTVTPQGIMAICKKQIHTVNNMVADACLLLLCEAVSDPGNVGTLIRTANAAGASGVILTQGCADLFNPKVIRASAGALFQIPCIVNEDALKVTNFLKSNNILLAAAHLKSDASPYCVDMTKAICIMIGNESLGLSGKISAQADISVKIPMKANAESLNAASAGAVLLFEAVRQRLSTSPYQ